MPIHEDPELEKAALSGAFGMIVPVSIVAPVNGSVIITAYDCVWDICTDFERECLSDPLSDDAVGHLLSQVSKIAHELGFALDRHASSVIREYAANAENDAIRRFSADAKTVRSANDIVGFKCNLLHKPEAYDISDDFPIAVAFCDDEIVSLAAINDYSDTDAVEIHVETARDFRHRGYGRAVVAALASDLIDSGNTVSYKCFEKNVPSVHLAESLGFSLECRRLDAVCYAIA